jgi:polyferredoxin
VWWGWACAAVLLAVAGVFASYALRRAPYEKICASRPELTRETWVLNYLLFFVIAPVVAFVLVLFLGR